MKSNYKQLGRYICPVDVRNKGLVTTKLLGISVEKCFIPSIANIIGTDLEKYKIVRKGQFAYIPDTSRRGDKIAVALLKEEDICIISSAYTAFEITDTNELDPEYLMLWFSRPEFDRYARFHSHGSVREIFGWDEMCRVKLPVPDIEEQRDVVRKIRRIDKRIETLEILESKVTGVGGLVVRKESNNTIIICGSETQAPKLNNGYSYQEVKAFAMRMTSGATPARQESSYWDEREVPWLKSGEVQNGICNTPEEFISSMALKETSVHLMPEDTVLMAMYGATAGNVGYLMEPSTTNQAVCCMQCADNDYSAYLFFSLLAYREEIKRHANGGAQDNLSKEFIAKIKIVIPSHRRIKELNLSKIVSLLKLISREKVSLTKLRALLSEQRS